MRRIILLAAGIALLFAVPPAAAQQAGPAASSKPTAAKPISDLYVDFAVPDLPALSLVGISPSKVARPGNLKELSVAVAPAAASGTDIGPNVAVAWTPGYTFLKSVDAYRNNAFRRFAVSFATAKAGAAEVDAGIGARVILLDRSDPLLDPTYAGEVLAILSADHLDRTAANALNSEPLRSRLIELAKAATHSADCSSDACAQKLDELRTEWRATLKLASDEAVAAKLKKKLDEGRAAFIAQHWNAAVVHLDAGVVLRSDDSSWSRLTRDRVAAQLGAALPAGDHGQLLLQVQGRTGVGTLPSEKSYWSAGGRLLLGSATSRVSFEAAFGHLRSADSAKTGDERRFTIGTEFKLADGFWLELAVGASQTPGTGSAARSSLLSLAQLKYAINAKPRYPDVSK